MKVHMVRNDCTFVNYAMQAATNLRWCLGDFVASLPLRVFLE
jgi:hypothetical protein